MRLMMYRWWCEGGGDRAWRVIESVFLRSLDKGFWACLGDIPPDMPMGRGGLEFLLLANFFFTSERKQSFFWRSTSDNFLLMFRRRNFLSYAFPIMYVTIWCFFWSTYFSSISTTNFFFCPHFQQTFFLTFVATNYLFQFFSSPPPPDIKWCVP